MELGVTQLDPANMSQDTVSACNNAAWSLGELAIKGSCQGDLDISSNRRRSLAFSAFWSTAIVNLSCQQAGVRAAGFVIGGKARAGFDSAARDDAQ
eukprot:scaffold43977_cov26-Prasinocladus_malaysianus.AAC.1